MLEFYKIVINDEDRLQQFPIYLNYEECIGVNKNKSGCFETNCPEVLALLAESGIDQAISENDILDLSYQFYNIDFEDMIEDCCYFIWDYRKKLESLFKEYSINFSKYSDSENVHDKSNIIYKFEVDSNNKTAILNKIELLQESLKADIQDIPAASYKFKGVKIFNIKIKYDNNIIFKIYTI